MSDPEKPARSHTAHISGGVSGQFAQGDGNVQTQVHGTPKAADPADLAELRRMLDELRAQVEAAAPPEKRVEAVQQVEEIGKAIESPDPADPADLPDRLTVVKRWFKDHLPALAGAVVSVIVNPIVGKVVEAAGTGLAAEVQRRFGAGK
jgi:hypothetical protein